MFHFPIRIYYEDTDAGGVVYYANYLKFLERCRTEWLRAGGYDQSRLLDEARIAFVVRRVEADYLRPARLDDQLDVGLRVEKIGAAQIVFTQTVSRIGAGAAPELLLSARVQIVSIDIDHFRPAALPAWIKTQLQEQVTRA